MLLRSWGGAFALAQQQRIDVANLLSSGTVDPDLFVPTLQRLADHERLVRNDMIAAYRRVAPAGVQEFVKETLGLGEPSVARLLGLLGHPRRARPYHWEGVGKERVLVADPEFDRSVGQLWQYCGVGAPGRRRRGMTAEEVAAFGNSAIRPVVFNMAETTKRVMRSPYRAIYEDRRVRYEGQVHETECANCGTKGSPAPPGSPWRKGHQQGAALRVVGKEILRDLWEAAA